MSLEQSLLKGHINYQQAEIPNIWEYINPTGAQPSCSPFSQHRWVALWYHALWSPVTQTPPETPWPTCPRWAVRASCLAAGVAVQAEGLLLGSVHHIEA